MKRNLKLDIILIYIFILIVVFLCLFPMILLIIVSITDNSTLIREGIKLIPSKISFFAYRLIFNKDNAIFQSYIITTIITITGTLTALTITALAGYTLSNTQVKMRNQLAFFFFLTMLFSGGIVPWYIINKQLGLYDNIFALIIPSLLFNPFNMFLVRNFMKGLPNSLRESARIDGANDIVIAFRIYLPLSKPVLAAVALFYGIAYWNSWWNAIMLVDNTKLYPLQFLLLAIRSQLRGLQIQGISSLKIPGEPMKSAVTLITIGPIILFYPFLQRYFIKGIIIGAVKG